MPSSLLLLVVSLTSLVANVESIHAPNSLTHNVQPSSIQSSTKSHGDIIQLREKLLQQFSHDMSKLQLLPVTKLTTPCHLISKDTSNTKAWKLEDWDRHCASSLERYTRHVRSWPRSTSTRSILPTVLLVLSWSTIILFATSKYSPPIIANLILQSSLSYGLIGTFLSPIALLLSLRANQALNRLMDVRKAWGQMSRSTRSLAGVIATYGVFAIQSNGEAKDNDAELMTTSFLAAKYLAIFGWCMKAAFRKDEDDTDIIRAVLPHPEADWLLSSPSKRPIAILSRLRFLIQQLSTSLEIPPMIHLTLEQRLYDLEASFGTCNRILMSPIPPTYTRHTSRVLCLFLFLLPLNFAGSKTSPLALLLSVMIITYVLVGIDEIGLEIEHPFPLLPMQEMAATFQKNVENQFVLPRGVYS